MPEHQYRLVVGLIALAGGSLAVGAALAFLAVRLRLDRLTLPLAMLGMASVLIGVAFAVWAGGRRG